MEKNVKIQIQKVLDMVAREGTYSTGHILMIEEIVNIEVGKVQRGIKDLLNITDCYCDN